VDSWTEKEIYNQIGSPVKEKVIMLSQSKLVSSAPEYLVEATDLSRIDPEWLTERILLIDFSVSFFSDCPPAEGIGTPLSYRSPEAIFDLKVGIASDIWALGCSIFELRAGCQLFASFVGGSDEVTRQIVQTLGKLPSPWWTKWEPRHKYFEEDGKPRTNWDNRIPLACEYSLGEQIHDIGSEDNVDEDTIGRSSTSAKSILEVRGTPLSEQEATLLEDLLQQMVVYDTNARLPANEVRNHPWFSYRT
jgi:serine/threonine-protein kinase SRPK3